jgi:hypothetical protein
MNIFIRLDVLMLFVDSVNCSLLYITLLVMLGHENNLYDSTKRMWSVELIMDEMGGPCSTNGGEEEHLQIIGGKARGKETTRKTKT